MTLTVDLTFNPRKWRLWWWADKLVYGSQAGLWIGPFCLTIFGMIG